MTKPPLQHNLSPAELEQWLRDTGQADDPFARGYLSSIRAFTHFLWELTSLLCDLQTQTERESIAARFTKKLERQSKKNKNAERFATRKSCNGISGFRGRRAGRCPECRLG